MYDIVILGGGPAGLSAAVAARGKGKSVLVLTRPAEENPLWKAPLVDNYLGLPGVSGAEMLQAFTRHALDMGTEIRHDKVLAMLPMGDRWALTVGQDMVEGRRIILAHGVVRQARIPGEERYLGRGVSYCATCDGMLYRGKAVVVVGRSKDAPQEANWLREIGCQVTYVSSARPEGLRPDIPTVVAKKLTVEGEQVVTALTADGGRLPCEGIFLLRETVAPTDLLPALETENGYIKVDRSMATSVKGVYAAGDCTGLPLQVSKAVGEGLIAGEAAADSLAEAPGA